MTKEPHRQILLSKESIEKHLDVTLTDAQYYEVAKAIYELASLIIESTCIPPEILKQLKGDNP